MRDGVILTLLLAAGAFFALAAATGEPAGSGQPGRTVEVSMQHSRFLLDETTFMAGETVTFVLRNRDPIDHEFILGDEALQLGHETGTEPYHDEIPSEVTVPALSTVSTTVEMPHYGPLIIGCHLPGHYGYGMRTQITVE
ncbi:MAG: hypothetical protein WD602_06120 [Actinomycetota bacterium]